MTIYHIHAKIMKWKHSKKEVTLIKKRVSNANKFNILYFQKSNTCNLCFKTLCNWRAFLFWCCSFSCLSINLSCTDSENMPNIFIHELFSQKLGFWTFRETASMNNFTTRRKNEQQPLNRMKIKLGVKEAGGQTERGRRKKKEVLLTVFYRWSRFYLDYTF